MNVVPFNRQHFAHIYKWLEARDAHFTPVDRVPGIGFMCYYNHKPAAAGFIRLVEGGYGQLEGLVSNPEFLPGTRSKAIDTLVERIIAEAKALQLISLIAFTGDKNTLERSSRHGFVQLPQTLIAVDLSSN